MTMTPGGSNFQTLPERHTDFVFSWSVESWPSLIVAILVVAGAVGAWQVLRRRRASRSR